MLQPINIKVPYNLHVNYRTHKFQIMDKSYGQEINIELDQYWLYVEEAFADVE